MKILFYRNDWNANYQRQQADGYGGIGYYRIVNPAKYTKGHDVTVVGSGLKHKGESRDQMWNRIFTDYDVFWTSYFTDSEEASSMYYHRDKYKKKVVIDLDDDFWSVSPTHSLYDTYKPTKRNRAFTGTILSFADVITVSTETLKQKVLSQMRGIYEMQKKVFIVPNMNCIEDWNFKPTKKHKDKIVVGYTGSNSHNDDLAMFLPQLGKVMDKYKQVHFESIGSIGKVNIHLFKGWSDEAMKRCDILPSSWTFSEYPALLAKSKWDIGVAPLVDDEFNRARTHIKWMEYGVYKIPTIASRVYPYFMPAFNRTTIDDGHTGFLCKPSEWVEKLEMLIMDEGLRKRVGEQARDAIASEWQYGEDFTDRINEVLEALD